MAVRLCSYHQLVPGGRTAPHRTAVAKPGPTTTAGDSLPLTTLRSAHRHLALRKPSHLRLSFSLDSKIPPNPRKRFRHLPNCRAEAAFSTALAAKNNQAKKKSAFVLVSSRFLTVCWPQHRAHQASKDLINQPRSAKKGFEKLLKKLPR